MGRINKKGLIGSISGKVGDVVISEWNDIPVVRSTPKRRRKRFSAAQQAQQIRMAQIARFAAPIKKVLAIGFKGQAVKMSGYNAAVKDILRHAITGEYPNLRVNFSKVQISQGRFLNEANASATLQDGKIVFTWTYETADDQSIAGNDKAILVVYCDARGNALYTLNGPERAAQTGSIAVGRYEGYEVHTWLAFVSADGQTTSCSSYTGKLFIT